MAFIIVLFVGFVSGFVACAALSVDRMNDSYNEGFRDGQTEALKLKQRFDKGGK